MEETCASFSCFWRGQEWADRKRDRHECHQPFNNGWVKREEEGLQAKGRDWGRTLRGTTLVSIKKHVFKVWLEHWEGQRPKGDWGGWQGPGYCKLHSKCDGKPPTNFKSTIALPSSRDLPHHYPKPWSLGLLPWATWWQLLHQCLRIPCSMFDVPEMNLTPANPHELWVETFLSNSTMWSAALCCLLPCFSCCSVHPLGLKPSPIPQPGGLRPLATLLSYDH